VPDGIKSCRACGESKPLVEFHRMASMSDGRRPSCKACTRFAEHRRNRRPKLCEVCGNLHTNPRGKTCSQACKWFLLDHAKSSQVPWDQCEACDGWFVRRSASRACGDACSERLRRRRVEDGRRCRECGAQRRKNQHFCDPCRAIRREQQIRVFEEFKKNRIKSPESKARERFRRRARKHGVEYENVDRAYILKRDGFVCQLCRKPLMMDVEYPHPLYPTMDHVIPLAMGGSHVVSNVQAAHMICNSRKGAKGGPEQLLLIG
jgi:5-methylcytosine-specific restriction endonuclease McrA